MLNLRVTDLKQYLFCPSIVYYQVFLPVRPVTSKMRIGSKYHISEEQLERRRGFRKYRLQDGKKWYHKRLYSPSLGLSGLLDLLVETETGLYPVEYKLSFREAMLNAKVQLAAYAMMLREQSDKDVTVGFVYCIPTNRVYEVPITDSLCDLVHRCIDDICSIIEKEQRPDISRPRAWCLECEFRRFCTDIL